MSEQKFVPYNKKVKKIYYKHYRYYDENQDDIPLRKVRFRLPDGKYIYAYDTIETKKENVLHHYSKGKTQWPPTCKGGLTECHILMNDGTEIVGRAECSRKDNFQYSIGRKLAFGRASQAYHKLLE